MARTQRQGKRSNTARKQARAVRTTSTPTDAAVSEASMVTSSGVATAPARTSKPYQAGRKQAAPRPVVTANVLSREQEYAFIREDLVRLLITSGILTVVMIALLFVVDR